MTDSPQLLTRRDAAKLLDIDSPLLLRQADAAKLLGNMSESTLEKLTSRKQIPHAKIGRSVYYDVLDLRAWIEAKKVPAKKLASPSPTR